MCHELNIMTKVSDQEFFREVVRPHIQNKLEKGFVDHYLLDSPWCLEWLEIDKLTQLNAFEKLLLVRYLMVHSASVSVSDQMDGVMMQDRARVIAEEMHNQTSLKSGKRDLEQKIDANMLQMRVEHHTLHQHSSKSDVSS